MIKPPVALLLSTLALLLAAPTSAAAQARPDPITSDTALSPAEAWWTGPMLANSANTLPHGHVLIETYLFDQIASHSELYGSLTYMLYGVTDRFTVGMKPMFGMVRIDGRTSDLGFGDLTLVGQYQLTSPASARMSPKVSIALQRSLTTGRHDRLDTDPDPGLGAGAPTTTLSLYGQKLFRLSNNRAFRARINFSRTFSNHADLRGASVYGTGPGFRGRAAPGDATSIGVAGEYSVTRNWVLALDAFYDRNEKTAVAGAYGAAAPVRFDIPSSGSIALAPAIEYNFTSNFGILFGTRFRLRGHNSAPSITPAIAFNFVH